MKLLKFFGVFIITLLCSAKFLENEGFCIKKLKFLPNIYTKQQLIDKAILYEIKNIPETIHFLNGRPPIRLKKYSGLEEFKKLNSECCELTDKGPEGYTNSSYLGFIKINYYIFRDKKTSDKNDIESITETYIAYDSCGNLYGGYVD